MKSFTKITLLTGAMILALSACSSDDDDDDDVSQSYRISITNLTNAQPLSPPVAMLHAKSISFWQIGEQASVALEMMAEGGDGSALLDLHDDNPQHAELAALAPGAKTEFTLEMDDDNSGSYLSVAGMLVNTNDAFSGITGINLDGLAPGQSIEMLTHAYDAGTEMNTESAGTIPGPADGGTGFDAVRDDLTSVVTLHSGVVTVDDSHATSTLTETDKFDNPTLRIEVTAL